MIARTRRTRQHDRSAFPHRDVNLVIVATEDTHAAKQYFDELQSLGLVDRSRVCIVSLPTESGRSSLSALVDRLKDHRDGLNLKLDQDEYWAVFDLDQQPAHNLAEAVRVARTRGFRMAGSNPCFELWLLLHITGNVAGIPSATGDRHAARICGQRLHETLQAGDARAQGYDKARIYPERFTVPDRVRDACQRARDLSPSSEEPWPTGVGTHVHLLVEPLLLVERSPTVPIG